MYAEPIRFVDFCHWPPELSWDVLVIKLDDYATYKSNYIRPINLIRPRRCICVASMDTTCHSASSIWTSRNRPIMIEPFVNPWFVSFMSHAQTVLSKSLFPRLSYFVCFLRAPFVQYQESLPLGRSHSRPQSLRSFWPAAGIESSGSNHFEITKEITEFCPSGLIKSSSMAHARNGCSQSSRFLPQARRIVGSGDENGKVQHRKSWIHGIPVTLRMLRANLANLTG